jgi:hypothetical protein
MGFFEAFDPPEPPREPVEYRQPPWVGPPPNVRPASVAFDAVLAQTPELAAWVSGGAASPQGLAFSLVVVSRRRPVADDDPLWPRPGRDATVRFGVGFADGRRATMDAPPWRQVTEGDRAPEIVLMGRGGHGSMRGWAREVWLWPLPPEGPVTFAFAWPSEGIEEVTVEVDSAPIRAAAARAVQLWPDDRPEPPAEGGCGWTSYAPG